jgi:NET1-associated nuclear protein 1 (U3 small nucleolar RNA-associated protein 17)
MGVRWYIPSQVITLTLFIRQLINTLGTYIVSGGLETVLVLWQLETGYKQFLPHMGAAIKNIVVSPLGSTYAVSLSDNSIMTLSTSELSPRTNVAGIQCAAQIRRSERHRAAPCLLHPFIANNLLVATPSNQLDQSASSPYLQTFDTYSDRHISKQALTRTNATIFNQSAEKSAISEPDITFLAATNDGQWLASIDEWQPSKMNALVEEPALNLHAEKKREVYLKFWNWSKLKRKWDLITRVDAPHPSPDEWGVESVLDLIAAPNGHAFVTLGSDGCVKIWRPKMRASTSVCSAACTVNWGHQMSVNFSKKLHYTVFLPLVIADAEQQIQHKRWWGNVAFSEDGSLLAVSCPDPGFSTRDSVLHLIDPASGSICDSLSGLHIGRTNNLAILRHYLIVAGSQKLLVWNLVNSRVEWEYTISELTPTPSPTFHLAVDRKDHTFAIAFSLFSKKQIGAKILVWGLVSDPKPVFTQDLEVPIAALKSAGDGKGFFVLDTHARIQYITPLHATHASVVSIVTSGQQVEIPDAYAFSLLNLMDMNGEAEIDMDITDNELEKVMAREMLAALFDDFEIYGQGSVEAAFEGVMGLYAMTQLGSEVKEDEEEGNGEGEDRSDVEVGDAGKVDSD